MPATWSERPRVARCVVPGVPHHVTQRGNRRQLTFFEQSDFQRYKALLRRGCEVHSVRLWAYCLMPNHVHLILEPSDEHSLAKAMGWIHQRYTWRVNQRMGWRGFLWQGRFWSCPLDERHLRASAKYVLLNPVRAGLVERVEQWPHSSLQAHSSGQSDGLVELHPLAARIPDWSEFLAEPVEREAEHKLRRYSRSGLPLGDESFVRDLERRLGRSLTLRQRGRPKRGPEST